MLGGILNSMVKILVLIALSLILTFILAIPFIRLLFTFNIRRIAKVDLDKVLPGRSVKLGTPIMGGLIIIFSVSILSTIFLKTWDTYPIFLFILLAGCFVGAVDEYTNTLGRTFLAVRISKGSHFSLFPFKGILKIMKKVLTFPWKIFENILESMGSAQRGLKSSYKISLQFLVVLIPTIYLIYNGHGAYTIIPLYGAVNLGFLYFPLAVFLMLFFANAFGITDGMDGISAGTHSIAFLSLGVLSYFFGFKEIASLSFIIFGAELAFLYFNIYPARVEMSDVGTFPLGSIFAFFAILLHAEIILFFIGFIFFAEIMSSILQVWAVKITGKRLFLIAPIHHHFERIGWVETKVTTRIWLFSAVTAIFGLLVALL